MEPPKRNLDVEFAREGGSNTPHTETANADTVETIVTPTTANMPFSQMPVSAETLMTLVSMLQSKSSLPGGVIAHASAVPQKDVLRITAAGEMEGPQNDKGVKRPDPNELKDYSSAHEDSSEDVVEDRHGRVKEMMRKKADVEKMLRELNEEIARDLASKAKPAHEPVRTDRKAILKEPVATSAAISKKRRFKNEGDSKYNPRTDSHVRSAFCMRGSPFTEEILSDPMLLSFRLISIEYDDKGDPEAHMSRFEGLMNPHQYSEGVKYRIFSTTLVNAAEHWSQQLPEESIACFEDLYQVFMSQFASSRITGKRVMSLLTMKQGEDESLQSFSTRFNLANLEVPSAEPQLRTYVFIRGLRNGLFFDNLHTNPPLCYDELLE